MELRIYGQDLKLKGITENQTSVIWTRKYYDCGNFEIHLPITTYNAELYQLNNLVTIYGAKEAGIIENIKYTQTNKKNEMVVKGRFLESYMDRRVIHPTVNFSGKLEVGMRQLLSDITPILPYVELGDLQGYEDTVSFQCSWKTLLNAETKLAQSANVGFRFRPDFENRKIYFEVYKGLDRTRTQHDRSFVEFSEEFDNLNSAIYTVNNKTEKTVVYVLGEGEGSDRTCVIVGDDSGTGYERRELYVDARDLLSTDLTEEEYEATLEQRGLEKLEEYALSKSFECDTIPLGNFTYKTGYDLGDIVTVKKEKWGITDEFRITELMEVYEHEQMEVVPTLGNPLPTTLDMED